MRDLKPMWGVPGRRMPKKKKKKRGGGRRGNTTWERRACFSWLEKRTSDRFSTVNVEKLAEAARYDDDPTQATSGGDARASGDSASARRGRVGTRSNITGAAAGGGNGNDNPVTGTNKDEFGHL